MREDILYLEEKAQELRKNVLTMIYKAQSGHPGGSFSLADIITVLYYSVLHIDPKHPTSDQRDRLILSKGHVCPVLYAILAMKGYYDMEVLATLRQLGSILQGHPDMNKVPGVDMTTGSLGQGISAGVGMAIGLKAKLSKRKVFVMVGDGETNEGQVWEAAMCAVKYKLDNMVVIVDRNNLQNDGGCKDIMPTESMKEKWAAFGWQVFEVDGHDIQALLAVFAQIDTVVDKPICIVAKTVKGKGVSFMENICEWHGMAPNDEQYKEALCELGQGVTR